MPVVTLIQCDWCRAEERVASGEYFPRDWDTHTPEGTLCPACVDARQGAVTTAIDNVRAKRRAAAEDEAKTAPEASS